MAIHLKRRQAEQIGHGLHATMQGLIWSAPLLAISSQGCPAVRDFLDLVFRELNTCSSFGRPQGLIQEKIIEGLNKPVALCGRASPSSSSSHWIQIATESRLDVMIEPNEIITQTGQAGAAEMSGDDDTGGIILAPEGINGSICGTPEAVEKVLKYIQADSCLKGLRMIQSPVTPEDEAIHHGHTSHSPVGAGEDAPFRWDHVRVKLKKEIVTLGDPGVMPTKMVGKYVKPKDWNALISDPDTVVIDVRNMYEIRIGKFKRAVDPCTNSFREFPSWVDDQFDLAESDSQPSSGDDSITGGPLEDLGSRKSKELPRVAMYCTGGIRCEKASSFLLSKGFKEVYHLEGGILKYLEEIPKAESLWDGECFVFDKRVSVEHGLAQGTHKLCYGCKQPVSDEDMESHEWEYGVSCPYCFATKSEEEKERARARQRQFETWGVIGGPDKGRGPKKLEANRTAEETKQFSSSV
uniref:Rhodanese domain-containing protein n=1 Tax=Oryza brachyantha TaxID=4533 RepID=J3M5Z8_ORYBR